MQVKDVILQIPLTKALKETYPYIEIGDIDVDNKTYVLKDKRSVSGSIMAKKGAILISTVRPTRRAISFLKEKEAAVSNAFAVLYANEDICLKEYLFFQLNNSKFFEYLGKNSKGATYPTCSKDDIYNYEIIVPSIKEQRIIIDLFSSISSILSRKKEQLKLLDELVKARFIEMFGDPIANPNGYPVKSLTKIADYWNGLTYKPEDVANIGTIVLRSSNIQNSTLDFADTVRVSCKISDKKFVKNNDILMCSRNGSARLVGKVAMIRDINEPMSFGAFMMIIRSAYYPYLMIYFQMPAFRSQITTGATTTINQITTKMLDDVKLPVPDLNTINQFACFMSQVDKSKLVVQKGLQELEILKKSLMQQYFG